VKHFSAANLRRLLNLWPPFLFAGIRVTAMAEDFRHARVELRMRPWNRNYVGTHFGGSLFAMTDPFWMLLVMHALGRDYIVWDQAAEIVFLKPGRGTVRADFRLEEAALEEIRAASGAGTDDHGSRPDVQASPVRASQREPSPFADSRRAAARCDGSVTVLPSGAVLRWFETEVLDQAGDAVVRVRKQLYVRRKNR
jgi:acyl-coenzyme A thioesterase PaaI-like protein